MPIAHTTAPRILVVEDIEETRDGIAHLLTADGYRVEPARDEEDAVGRATRLPPHLLLVSLGGPPAEVLTTAVRIRHRAHLRPAVPIVIFCTPIVAEGAEVELAGQVYLTRPDNFDQLRALLQRLLCPTPGRGQRRAGASALPRFSRADSIRTPRLPTRGDRQS